MRKIKWSQSQDKVVTVRKIKWSQSKRLKIAKNAISMRVFVVRGVLPCIYYVIYVAFEVPDFYEKSGLFLCVGGISPRYRSPLPLEEMRTLRCCVRTQKCDGSLLCCSCLLIACGMQSGLLLARFSRSVRKQKKTKGLSLGPRTHCVTRCQTPSVQTIALLIPASIAI